MRKPTVRKPAIKPLDAQEMERYHHARRLKDGVIPQGDGWYELPRKKQKYDNHMVYVLDGGVYDVEGAETVYRGTVNTIFSPSERDRAIKELSEMPVVVSEHGQIKYQL